MEVCAGCAGRSTSAQIRERRNFPEQEDSSAFRYAVREDVIFPRQEKNLKGFGSKVSIALKGKEWRHKSA